MDDNLRYAIWQAHDRRCLYTGEYLEDFKALEIDHIIPESTPADILAEKIRIHNLGNDFNVKTSLTNLAPSTRLANAKKGKDPFPLQRETYYLEIVSRKVEQVKANLAKIKAQQLQKRKWLIENKSGNDSATPVPSAASTFPVPKRRSPPPRPIRSSSTRIASNW